MPKVLDKRSAILNNALDLLVEHGFHNTPMSLISKEARVSAGIIYHYFESKEELILELYREIKQKFVELLFAGEPPKLDSLDAMTQVWLNAYHYYVSHPRETLFLEQFENSPYARMCKDEFEENIRPIMQWVESEMEAGKIIKLPFDVLETLTFGVAISLAKQQIAGTVNIDEATLNQVVKAIRHSLQPN